MNRDRIHFYEVIRPGRSRVIEAAKVVGLLVFLLSGIAAIYVAILLAAAMSGAL